jgi:pimeloyl-ACP methyl ester carboxylesterase
MVWRRGLMGSGRFCGLGTAVAILALAANSESSLAQAPATTGLQRGVIFTDASPLSSNLEMARRMISPLKTAEIPALLERSGKGLSEQPVNLADERFTLYAPPHMPAQGYGVLVFVPPWPEAVLPEGWADVLDRYGVIFVTAARSGNDASPLGRREPLALIAATEIMRRYKVDPERVYIGGFSGGARIAMRLALGYPDLFRGAFLDAGSDPIGDAVTPLPPRDLFWRFQTSTRLVYVTGDEDPGHLDMAVDSQASMHEWCVYDIDAETIPHTGHQIAGAAALAEALRALQTHAAVNPAKLGACRAAIDRDLDAKLNQVSVLLANRKGEEAQKLLTRIDDRFGGLAAPRSVDLAARIAAIQK